MKIEIRKIPATEYKTVTLILKINGEFRAGSIINPEIVDASKYFSDIIAEEIKSKYFLRRSNARRKMGTDTARKRNRKV